MNVAADVLRSIDEIVFAKDLEGRYIFGNDAWAALLGGTVTELLGRSDRDLFPAEVAAEFAGNDQAMLAGGVSRTNEEWVQYPDGRRALLETSKSPLRDASGNVIGVVGVCREIQAPREC